MNVPVITLSVIGFVIDGSNLKEMRHMRIESKYIYRFLCAVSLTCVNASLFFFVWYRFVSNLTKTQHLMGKGNLGMSIGLYVLLYLLWSLFTHAFKIGVERKSSLIAAQIISIVLTNAVECFLSSAITGQFRYFFEFVFRYFLLGCAQAIIVFALIILMVDLYRRVYKPLKLIEVFGDSEDDLFQEINSVPYKYSVLKRLHYTDGKLDDLIDDFDAVLINDIPSGIENSIIKLCFERDKRLYFVPNLSDIITKSSDSLTLFDTPLYLCRNNGVSAIRLLIKRIFDIVASFLALILLSPVLAITALAVKLNDGGPVFFKQERCTIAGKRFMIIKFRSMVVDAEKDGKAHPAGDNDDRITKVGRFIRSTRIDELPQLLNILKGDMSIVGPRPERWEHVEKYTNDIPEFAYRLKVKGGLTGYAQVYGKYNTSAINKLKMDLLYITNFSLLLDLQIMIETLKILFRRESTSGFSEEKALEMHDYSTSENLQER